MEGSASRPLGGIRRKAERQRDDREQRGGKVSAAFRRRAAANERRWLAKLASGLAPFPRRPPKG